MNKKAKECHLNIGIGTIYAGVNGELEFTQKTLENIGQSTNNKNLFPSSKTLNS